MHIIIYLLRRIYEFTRTVCYNSSCIVCYEYSSIAYIMMKLLSRTRTKKKVPAKYLGINNNDE